MYFIIYNFINLENKNRSNQFIDFYNIPIFNSNFPLDLNFYSKLILFNINSISCSALYNNKNKSLDILYFSFSENNEKVIYKLQSFEIGELISYSMDFIVNKSKPYLVTASINSKSNNSIIIYKVILSDNNSRMLDLIYIEFGTNLYTIIDSIKSIGSWLFISLRNPNVLISYIFNGFDYNGLSGNIISILNFSSSNSVKAIDLFIKEDSIYGDIILYYLTNNIQYSESNTIKSIETNIVKLNYEFNDDKNNCLLLDNKLTTKTSNGGNVCAIRCPMNKYYDYNQAKCSECSDNIYVHNKCVNDCSSNSFELNILGYCNSSEYQDYLLGHSKLYDYLYSCKSDKIFCDNKELLSFSNKLKNNCLKCNSNQVKENSNLCIDPKVPYINPFTNEKSYCNFFSNKNILKEINSSYSNKYNYLKNLINNDLIPSFYSLMENNCSYECEYDNTILLNNVCQCKQEYKLLLNTNLDINSKNYCVDTCPNNTIEYKKQSIYVCDYCLDKNKKYVENNICVSECSIGYYLYNDVCLKGKDCLNNEFYYNNNNSCDELCPNEPLTGKKNFPINYCEICNDFKDKEADICVEKCDYRKGINISNSKILSKLCTYCLVDNKEVAINGKCIENGICPGDMLNIIEINQNNNKKYEYCTQACGFNEVYEDKKCKSSCKNKGHIANINNKYRCEFCKNNTFLENGICVSKCSIVGNRTNYDYRMCEPCKKNLYYYAVDNTCISLQQCNSISSFAAITDSVTFNNVCVDCSTLLKHKNNNIEKHTSKYKVKEIDKCVDNCNVIHYGVDLPNVIEINNNSVNTTICKPCLNNKYALNGICVDKCPSYLKSNSYIDQNNITSLYCSRCKENTLIENNICVDNCSDNYVPNENNECICDIKKFYIKINKNIEQTNLKSNHSCVLKCNDSDVVDEKNRICITCNIKLEYYFNNKCISNKIKCPTNFIITIDESNNSTKKCICDTSKFYLLLSKNSDPICLDICPEGTQPMTTNNNKFCKICNNENYIENYYELGVCVKECSKKRIPYLIEKNKSYNDVKTCICEKDLVDINGSCINNCPLGYVQDSSMSKICIKCNKYTLLYDSGQKSICVDNCNSKDYVIDEYLKICKNCKDFKQLKYLNNCVTECPNYYKPDSKNINCIYDKDYNNKNMSCFDKGLIKQEDECVKNCSNEYYLLEEGIQKTCVKLCPINSHKFNGKCIICPSPLLYFLNGECLFKCPKNYISNYNNHCVICNDTINNKFNLDGVCVESCPIEYTAINFKGINNLCSSILNESQCVDYCYNEGQCNINKERYKIDCKCKSLYYGNRCQFNKLEINNKLEEVKKLINNLNVEHTNNKKLSNKFINDIDIISSIIKTSPNIFNNEKNSIISDMIIDKLSKISINQLIGMNSKIIDKDKYIYDVIDDTISTINLLDSKLK